MGDAPLESPRAALLQLAHGLWAARQSEASLRSPLSWEELRARARAAAPCELSADAIRLAHALRWFIHLQGEGSGRAGVRKQPLHRLRREPSGALRCDGPRPRRPAPEEPAPHASLERLVELAQRAADPR